MPRHLSWMITFGGAGLLLGACQQISGVDDLSVGEPAGQAGVTGTGASAGQGGASGSGAAPSTGGTGGGSTGGTAGAGGVATGGSGGMQTGGSGGAPACGLSIPTYPECSDCIATRCAAACSACVTDPICADMINCVLGCSESVLACVSTCSPADSNVAVNDVYACTEAECSQECGGGMANCVPDYSDARRATIVASSGNSFQMDITEVTNGRYCAWLGQAVAVSLPECATDSSFEPHGMWPPPPGRENHPVVMVDWCDAYAYCESHSLRLCGNISGGSVPSDEFDNPSVSQWQTACAGYSNRPYPYGDAYEPDICNGADASWGSTVEVGLLDQCAADMASAYSPRDLSGNVAEWVDSCEMNGSVLGDLCHVRGGSFESPENGLRCDANRAVSRHSGVNDVGFRCCEY